MFRINCSGRSSNEFENIVKSDLVNTSIKTDRIVDDSAYHPTNEYTQLETNGTVGVGNFDFYTEKELNKNLKGEGFDMTVLHNNHFTLAEINQIRKSIIDEIKNEVDNKKREQMENLALENGVAITSDTSASGSGDSKGE